MGLPGNPEPTKNFLMEPKTIHTYVHAYITPYQGLYICTYSMRVLSLMNIFLPGKPIKFSESKMGNTTTFQRSILVACNAQTPF